MPLDLSRRNFIRGLTAGIIAAPAVVKAASLMPLRGLVLDRGLGSHFEYYQTRFFWFSQMNPSAIQFSAPLGVQNWEPDGILRHELMSRAQVKERFGTDASV